MNIERKNLASLQPAEYNPRRQLQPGDPDYERIARSIETFGYVDPLIINKDGTVIGGHQRLRVLMDLGAEEADVVVLDLDKEHEKALNTIIENNEEFIKELQSNLDKFIENINQAKQ